MPMYEYKCATCDAQFEKLLPHSKADDVVCETCGVKAERILSRFGTGAAKPSMSVAPTPAAARTGGGHSCGAGCRH